MRVLIADDHRLILEGVRRALQEADDIEIVGEAQTGSEVLPLVARTKPDIAMLDLRMPGMDGLTCLDRIKARHPEVKVIILSVSIDPELIRTVLSRGASAYIVKSVNPSDLPSALRQVLAGTFFSVAGLPEASQESAAVKEAGLTERELVILKAVAQGMSNDAIAKQLWIAQQTVKFHLTNIYRKLAVANRTEATRYAYQHGLIENPVLDGA
jgi:DNA-binding NarL/FixJ family response regulator